MDTIRMEFGFWVSSAVRKILGGVLRIDWLVSLGVGLSVVCKFWNFKLNFKGFWTQKIQMNLIFTYSVIIFDALSFFKLKLETYIMSLICWRFGKQQKVHRS